MATVQSRPRWRSYNAAEETSSKIKHDRRGNWLDINVMLELKTYKPGPLSDGNARFTWNDEPVNLILQGSGAPLAAF
jgi:hypothetical protein